MRALIVDDDFVSRKLLQSILQSYGTCDVATDGEEAVYAFKLAWKEENPYDLICLDIVMPGVDGNAVLQQIRALEKEMYVPHARESKVIMTTVLDDTKSIMNAFKSQCEGYLVKPIEKAKMIALLSKLGLA